ncbi:MAG: CvpA family protein [Gammaproteobacteria bacterium]|jgi:membrane protein required for colicin V production|nr:CvpA family protein [Gammaproteobacteria bacterium]MBT5201917.1 CvpA family protein [Gammaproteobacteria bacterium]MBT5602434.1 CvpA family protein [Gammaproteobacteria bacterium]MBT6245222.1 CvpA family protein [Gammaproteobacteria bacterium]
MQMSNVDLIIIAVVAISTAISLLRGFVREALSLGVWVLALVVARVLSGPVAEILRPYIENSTMRLGVSYVVLIIATLFIGALLTNAVSDLVRRTGLSGTDRMIGLFFGAARGLIVVMIVVAVMYYLTALPEAPWWQESVLVPQVLRLIEWLSPLIFSKASVLLNTLTSSVLIAECCQTGELLAFAKTGHQTLSIL